MSRAKPIVERLHARMRRALALHGADRRATGRDRGNVEQLARIHPVTRMIVESREAFEVEGEILQVERRLPSKAGIRFDVLLVRSYAPPRWARNPYLRAMQVGTLERLVGEDRVSFPILGTRACALLSEWNAEDRATLDAHVARGRK